jgi:hypothetical protein
VFQVPVPLGGRCGRRLGVIRRCGGHVGDDERGRGLGEGGLRGFRR